MTKNVLIANLYSNKKLVGYRILSFDDKLTSHRYNDFINQNINILKRQKIENAIFKNNELIGTNGALSRYPKIDIDHGRTIKDCVVIVAKALVNGTIQYIVTNSTAQLQPLPNDNAVDLCKKYGVANGKVVNKGVPFISSISGDYPFIEQKSENSNNTESLWDLSNEDYSIEDHIKNFQEKHNKCINTLNEKLTWQLLYKIKPEKTMEYLESNDIKGFAEAMLKNAYPYKLLLDKSTISFNELTNHLKNLIKLSKTKNNLLELVLSY